MISVILKTNHRLSMKLLLILISVVFLNHDVRASGNAERLGRIRNLKRFAFGSCNKQYEPQKLWMDMISQRPQLFIWGGDNAYINSSNPDDIRAGYEMQNAVLHYQIFKSMVPIIGTWDDHDYGINNGDGHFISKVKSQEYALDFFEEPLTSPRRFQEGIYTSYEFGHGARKIKFILIDNRYHKDLDPDFPFLGKKQWEWLEDQINNSKASLHFIVSGLSVLSPPIPKSEEWADYPDEMNRLLNLVKNRAKGIVFLTGDKHFSSVFRRHGMLEFMSSGMTHNTRVPLRPYIQARFPSPLFERNYGMVDIKWKGSNPVITLYNRTEEGSVKNFNTFEWTGMDWEKIP